MPTHKYLTESEKKSLKINLKSLLDYHKLSYSEHEINSYTKKELKYLCYKYRIRLRGIDNKNNRWYRESIFN